MKKSHDKRPKKAPTDVRCHLESAGDLETIKQLESINDIKSILIYPSGVISLVPTSAQARERLLTAHLPPMAPRLVIESRDDEPEPEPEELEEIFDPPDESDGEVQEQEQAG